MVRVLLSAVLQEAAKRDVRISQIAKAFKVYKETGKAGTLIGRDVDIGLSVERKTPYFECGDVSSSAIAD